MTTMPSSSFQYVQEKDAFLALFPHRYDFIWANYPTPDAAVEWQTESRYPLSDRLIQQGSSLYGVRFGAETRYCLLDIDIGSTYHPKQDPFAIARIIGELEELGLTSAVICTSSYSGGLHLYFPFQQAQSSWRLAIVVSSILERAGFKIVPGQLEVFPNPKPYITEGKPSLFNAHRLPLQIGSYLVNTDFQPVWSTPPQFVDRWQFAESRNEIDPQRLKQLLKQIQRRHFRISGKADKFLNDLNAEIELGWTGYGQTNRLLGRITMRTFIFHHVLNGGEPLSGQSLVDEVVKVSRSLPGYFNWCQHQHEIEHRAEEWVRCIEASHYFHYGDQHGKFKAKTEQPELADAVEQAPTWNQQQSESARDRIRNAIADLLEKEILPRQATKRFKALLQYKIGGGSLYRHRDLWHPEFLINDSSDNLEVTILKIEPKNSTSLLYSNGGNCNCSDGSSDSTLRISAVPGGNSLISQEFHLDKHDNFEFLQAQAQQEACEVAIQEVIEQQSQHKAPTQAQIERMQQFLDSDDPILIAEATAWAQVHPGVLQSKGQEHCSGDASGSHECVRSSNFEEQPWQGSLTKDYGRERG